MLKAEFTPVVLRFKETAITSRDRMREKLTYLVKLTDTDRPGSIGVGECPLFRGLSAEDTPDFERLLREACEHPEELPEVSSIRFAFESARADLLSGGAQKWGDTPFTRGEEPIVINGLVWMGDKATMARRIGEKLDAGFRCVKLKIGGIDFDDEVRLLASIRERFGADQIEVRLDANGAFSPENAMERLERLARYDIHSIEQPIKAGQWEAMASVCARSPIPVALDEELIGFSSDERKRTLLDAIRPQYIILKPALCGGFREADRWIDLACERGIGWWATSALESNVGLGAIARWVSQRRLTMLQGLGTGALYVRNFPSALRLEADRLWCDPDAHISSAEIWKKAREI